MRNFLCFSSSLMEACIVHLFLHPKGLYILHYAGGFPNVDMTKMKGYHSNPHSTRLLVANTADPQTSKENTRCFYTKKALVLDINKESR
jgi:hypothetical protein